MKFLFNRAGNEANYDNVSLMDYREKFYDVKAEHVVLDVRSRGEFAGGHLPNALNIPLDQLDQRLKDIPKNKPVVVVCASGNRSRTGAKHLTQNGFEDVYNLKGGTMGWMIAGMPLES